MTSKIIYKGNLRCAATHLQSGSVILTDAPTDNNGKGEKFSPTDLVATALGSCMLTIMGIVADNHSININESECSIEKIMTSSPRKIGAIKVTMHVKGQDTYSDKEKSLLEKAALNCPVYLTLSEEVNKDVSFIWGG
jgi:putative redox protein